MSRMKLVRKDAPPAMQVTESLAGSIAYRGAVNLMSDNRRKWADEVGFNWQVLQSPIMWEHDEAYYYSEQRKVLYRSDTLELIGAPTNRYKPVQPAQVLQFFGDVCEKHKFTMQAAGQARGGKLLWGLAKTPYEVNLPGDDWLGNYLTMVTANDGTSATRGFFSSMRFGCTNMLPLMMYRAKQFAKRHEVVEAVKRITHTTEFLVSDMTRYVSALENHWGKFVTDAGKLASTHINPRMANVFFQLVAEPEISPMLQFDALPRHSIPRRMHDTYEDGRGQQNIRGTAWGLLNGVTRYIDHEQRARDGETRIASAWLGNGRRVKLRAYEIAMAIAENRFNALVDEHGGYPN